MCFHYTIVITVFWFLSQTLYNTLYIYNVFDFYPSPSVTSEDALTQAFYVATEVDTREDLEYGKTTVSKWAASIFYSE